MEITLSAIKADVGSIGGHTKPHRAMLAQANKLVQKAIQDGLLLDGLVVHTGDDIALIMSHTHGTDAEQVHTFAWGVFLEATEVAKQYGCYGAGQDLLADAPSSNVRGAGPGIAEIAFTFGAQGRAAESFMVWMADKCGPGAFNLPLYLSFADPMYNAGLMLPKMIAGFTFTVVDMNKTDGEYAIELNAPDELYQLAFLLRDNERFGLRAIVSREYSEQAVAASTDRLHSIAGKYTGKDDPIALIRNQGFFPAPEEILSPFMKAHYIGGGSRGSHVMPLMPVASNTPVAGPYCIPIISALGFSLSSTGMFSSEFVDFFANSVWDATRLRAQEKAMEMRSQGWSGAAMLPYDELEYGGYKVTMEEVLKRFKKR